MLPGVIGYESISHQRPHEYIDEHFADIVKHGSDIEARSDDSDCTVRWIKEVNSEYIGRFQQDQIVIDKDYESALEPVAIRAIISQEYTWDLNIREKDMEHILWTG